MSLWLKDAFALSEIVAGTAAHFIWQQFWLGLMQWVTRDEFAEGPHDAVANCLLRSVPNPSIGTGFRDGKLERPRCIVERRVSPDHDRSVEKTKIVQDALCLACCSQH